MVSNSIDLSNELASSELAPVLYVIILSAALDLVPPSTPKGIIAFCNIAPALVAKVAWPYILKGKIRYTKRIIGCWLMSTLGMFVSEGVSFRRRPSTNGIMAAEGRCSVRFTRLQIVRDRPRFIFVGCEDFPYKEDVQTNSCIS